MAALEALRSVVQAWLGGPLRPLERAAALRDVLALLELAPSPHPAARGLGGGQLAPLFGRAQALRTFLKEEVLPRLAGAGGPAPQVSAPYAGGLPAACLADLGGAQDSRGQAQPCQLSAIRLGVFNPGRTGFLALGTELLLDWRLEQVAVALLDHRVDICVLPGARFPPGALLPRGYPFAWVGDRSTGWDTVGLFIRLELEHVVRIREAWSEGRVLCVEVWSTSPGASAPAAALVACYPRPGGDRETWRRVLEVAPALRAEFPSARVLVAGDANIHLSYLVAHPSGCSCLHCKQSAADIEIQSWLAAQGWLACNPQIPTHSSVTVLDLVSRSQQDPLPVYVADHVI